MNSDVNPVSSGAAPVTASAGPSYKQNAVRDSTAGVLLILGLLLPWNVYFGVGIATTTGWVFGLLMVVTVSSLGALVVSHVGTRSMRLPDNDPRSLAGLRFALNVPYFVLAAGFVGFAVIQAIRTGGTADVPPGIGPGAWLGVAGAVLSAQSVFTSTDVVDERYGARVLRIIGFVSLILAVGAVLFNLYWRTRFVAPNIGDDETGTQNLVVFVAAVLYGAAALVPVVLVSRWIMSVDLAARLATVLIGSSALVAGAFVWILPVGRDLDAFHGIAQNTSTAGVGFEGYLAWVIAAAIVATPTVLSALAGASATIWRGAVRKCLMLIAIWCGSSAVLRIADLASASALDLPAPAYNGIALMAFDLVVALLAMWLFVNSAGAFTNRVLLALLSGILFVLSVTRVIVGIAMVPRVRPLNVTDVNDVYGNTLSQQITSTFDVALCVLALSLFLLAFVFASGSGREVTQPPPGRRVGAVQEPATHTAVGLETPEQTEQFSASAPDLWSRPVGLGAPVIAPMTTQIFAPTSDSELKTDESVPTASDRVAEVLAQSTQRFAAGTTYGSAGATKADQGSQSEE